MLQLITFRAEVTIYKSLLVQEQWEAGNRLLGKESKWDDFDKYVIIDKTVPLLSTDIRNMIRNNNLDSTRPQKIVSGKRIFYAGNTRLHDAAGNTAGRIIALYDATEQIAAGHKIQWLFIIISAFIISLLIIFYYTYVGRIEKQVHSYENQMEELVANRTAELHKAIVEVRTLSGFLPICASCKKIRDDTGYWNQLESYISAHSEVQFSHGICEDCATKLYPELYPPANKKESSEADRDIV